MTRVQKSRMENVHDPIKFGKSMLDMFGYIDQRTRVENLLREGMNLKVHRTGLRPDAVDGMSPREIMDMKEYLANDIVYEDKVEEYVRMNNAMKELELKFEKREKDALEARQKKLEVEKEAERKKIIAEYEASKVKLDDPPQPAVTE